MLKDNNEDFYEKMEKFVSYNTKMKSLKNITKGHKQRFINMIIEFLKFKGKTPEIQKWINYILIYHQKEINKYKKFVEEPVAKKLEQLFYEFCNNILTNQNKSNENINQNSSFISQKENVDQNNKSNTIESKIGKNKNDSNKSTQKENNNNNSHKINEMSQMNKLSQVNNINKEKREENLNKTNLSINDEGESKFRKKINQVIKKMNSFESIKEFIINSINKENKNNKIFCEIYQLLRNNLTQESINSKGKLLILICLIFPFISNRQKQQLQLIEQQFDKNFIKNLNESKLLNKYDNNNFSEYLLQSIINKEANVELINKIFHKNLFIFGVEELIELYQIYILSKIFKFNNSNVFLFKISFKIKFILKNYEFYAEKIGFDFKFIFKILWRLKNFYINIYQNKLIEDEEEEKINYIDIYFGEKTNDCELTKNYNAKNNNNLEILFFEEDNKGYDEFFKRINIFYKMSNHINLISGYSKDLKNYEFPFNIIELINFKNEFILNNFQKYKLNLINIEKSIYSLGYESLFPYNYTNPKNNISFYSINPYLKNVIKFLDIFFHKKFPNYKFKLYPYGSVTEFLSDKESDIDLFLDISEIEANRYKIKFLYSLFYIIKSFDKKASLTISTRVCVISFEFRFVRFDISVVGFCPYLHSTLIREYSLIDPRFPLLVIAVKHMVKILKINNISDDKTHSFLNSFSWVLLLIGFLQDIVKPPVLPKILQNSEILEKKAFFGNNKIEKEEDDDKNSEKSNEKKYEKISKTKNFESFINNMEIENIQLPNNLGDKKTRIKNYQKQIVEKNNMSCSELLLKFLEFVIFYFKYDTIFINCSLLKEGFQNFESINDEVSDVNNAFINYFNNKYMKKNKGEKNKDGYFLLRDPFDSRYNPGQTLKLSSLKKFFSRLKMAYYHLIKYGNLTLVKEQIDYEENTKDVLKHKISK